VSFQLPQVPCGARYFRCAFQVNPHGYAEKFRGAPNPMSKEEYIRAMLDKAEQLGIDVVAITDHNSVADVQRFADEAHARKIAVFPGFEVASKETGIHVLCLFEPGTNIERLNRVLGELGVHNTSPSSDLCDKGFSEILEVIERHGGLTIAAHVTESKGREKALQSGEAEAAKFT
jgi:DNA polymerase III alpha subunit